MIKFILATHFGLKLFKFHCSLSGQYITILEPPTKARDEKGKFDELVEDKGVKILIDPKALMHVIGTQMDFVDDTLKSEFIFINPNSKGQCGCGESFMTTSSGANKQGTS
ncbi:iron-sulfur assembly protein IscA-like 1, mitochondrial isoform X3 [Amborella trichopoda]|uniref:iron-sulfur assembly protein IscA-like 1, mitochondrial isoform X3 n=1 Tax=Amborella trichopoda TaxID=13333 RepID=UPI0009C0517D|nr:iron-sulfur assembly protein IscA-like 1, mitochondrial isoform X3 [Amborella trichopoda]|eukprot:XP_020528837.1 iron-sulfur assembly protein IscA-like 1, mitochondrial isoform X3 [Amborella trichopoda]